MDLTRATNSCCPVSPRLRIGWTSVFFRNQSTSRTLDGDQSCGARGWARLDGDQSCRTRGWACLDGDQSCRARGWACLDDEQSCNSRGWACLDGDQSCRAREWVCLDGDQSCAGGGGSLSFFELGIHVEAVSFLGFGIITSPFRTGSFILPSLEDS